MEEMADAAAAAEQAALDAAFAAQQAAEQQAAAFHVDGEEDNKQVCSDGSDGDFNPVKRRKRRHVSNRAQTVSDLYACSDFHK